MKDQEPGQGAGVPEGPAVIFSNWREILNFAPVPQAVRQGYTGSIEAYLEYCRHNGLSVTKDSARDFMADALRRRLAANPRLWKDGINWFFRIGRQSGGPLPPGAPSLGHADTGRTDWERRLIERLRLNHYSWRTEQTYRDWAWRFAQWLGPKGMAAAGGEDIRRFLTELAVRGRVGIATKKQALNALVFLFRQRLQRDPGDFSDFQRSPPSLAVVSGSPCKISPFRPSPSGGGLLPARPPLRTVRESFPSYGSGRSNRCACRGHRRQPNNQGE